MSVSITYQPTYTPTGIPPTFVVPAQVTSVTINATGAGANPGGAGGRIAGTITVTAGDVLSFDCGATGQGAPYIEQPGYGGASGGWGGTGTAGNGAAGGNATVIKKNGTVVAVAAGGGGVGRGSAFGAGGAGGAATGQAGVIGATGTAAGGGTQSAGGAAGGGSTGGAAGSSLAGGVGGGNSSTVWGGGGGGAGYFGGGGGGSSNGTGSGGGGGGSNYTGGMATVTTNTQGGGGASTVSGGATITYDPPPDQPTLTVPNNADNTAGFPITWVYSDQDPADAQSRADVRWRVGTGAWTTIAPAVTGAGASYTFAAGTFNSVIGQAVECQVMTYDTAGHTSPWSASSYFTPRTESASAPTITVAQGATFTSNTPTVTVTRATAFRYVRVRYTSTSGNATVGTFDAGSPVTSMNISLPTQAYVNGTAYTFIAAVSDYNDNLVPSAEGSAAASTAAVNAPSAPVISGVTINALTASISFNITNAAGDATPPVGNDIYRTDQTNNTPETRIATGVALNSTFTDWQPALNVTYRYRVVGVAANGSSTSSA